jgi:hypothetical protein
MAEHDISLVTAKAGTVIAENMKVSLATAAGALTPSTITAMVGIHNGTALKLPQSVTDVVNKLTPIAGNILHPFHIEANTALTNLTSLHTGMGFGSTPNHAAFGQVLNQTQGHIADSQELKKATDFISNTSFSDYGTGITNMSSMTTQGLDGALGDLGNVSKAFTAAGPAFDLKDMSKFGTSAGLIDKLNSVKLGNASGINGAIAGAGLDLSMPEHTAQVDKIMGSITDPKVISTVTEQLNISPGGSIANLKDLTDLSKLAPSGSGLTAANLPDMSAMASKFSDMGAKFSSPAAAAGMCSAIEIPSVPNLEASAPSLSGLMSGMSSNINSMVSGGLPITGSVPSMTDFMQHVSGGPAIDAFNSASIDANSIAALNTSITQTSSAFTNIGIDLSAPPLPSLGSSMSFATSLHKIGADTSGSGITDTLKNMVNPDTTGGDAIVASLAEGKNKSLMMAQGIAPLKFGG